MEADKRWIGQVLRHLQYESDQTIEGKECITRDIEVPPDVINVIRSSYPGYENVVFFDLETTGLLPKEDMITQIAAVSILLPAAKIRTFDAYVKPANGMSIPNQIREMTGISDNLLETVGLSEEKALRLLGRWLLGDSIVFAGHNVQFDLCFLFEALRRHPETCRDVLNIVEKADYFDTLTVYKDRRPSPHSLGAALTEYGASFQSRHHALEDAGGAFALAYFMACEKGDLRGYINRIGINPKYGLVGYEIGRIRYYEQEGVPAAENSLIKPKSL